MEQGKVKMPDSLEIAAQAWRTLLGALGPLSFEFNVRNADAITTLIDKLLQTGKYSMTEPFVSFLMEWLSEYERANVYIPDAAPVNVLRHLMEVNGLKQTDLAAELGGQSVVSAILRGKREINAGQASRLARKFGVSAAIFIDVSGVAAAPPITQKAEPQARYEIVGSNFTPITPAYLADSAAIQYVQ